MCDLTNAILKSNLQIAQTAIIRLTKYCAKQISFVRTTQVHIRSVSNGKAESKKIKSILLK